MCKCFHIKALKNTSTRRTQIKLKSQRVSKFFSILICLTNRVPRNIVWFSHNTSIIASQKAFKLKTYPSARLRNWLGICDLWLAKSLSIISFTNGFDIWGLLVGGSRKTLCSKTPCIKTSVYSCSLLTLVTISCRNRFGRVFRQKVPHLCISV